VGALWRNRRALRILIPTGDKTYGKQIYLSHF
jgi:hypothetical protein